MPTASPQLPHHRLRPLLVGYVLLQAVVIAGWAVVRPGYVLLNDSVAVPEQSLLPWMWGADRGPPRSVPQDALVAVADNVIPGWLVQSGMMLAGTVLLGLGLAWLMRQNPAFEQAAAATVAMWSTYVFERSLMGHWGLLLGLAALPWVLDAAADVRQGRRGATARLLGWSLIGSIVPTSGVLQVLAAAVVLAWPPVRTRWSALGAMAGVLAVQLVWIVPGLRVSTSSGEVAAEVFGLRSEGFGGPVLTVLGTGGIWNAAVVPDSRQGVLAVVAPVCLVALAAWGAARWGTLRASVVRPLIVLSLAGVSWALLTTVPSAAALVVGIEGLPGGGLLRDAHKWIAPWVVLLALSVALGLGRLRTRLRGSDAWWPGSVLLLLVPVLLLPDLAFGGLGRLRPVSYPSQWTSVRTHLAQSLMVGDVVSLPWSTFRAYSWNANRTVLDPAARFLPRPVVTDSRLLIQRDDELVVVPADDPRSVRVGQVLRSPRPAQGLLDLGIGFVLWQDDQPATPGYPRESPPWLKAAGRKVVDVGDLTLVELAGEASVDPPRGADLPLILAWLVWLVAPFGVLVTLWAYWRRNRRRNRGIDSGGSGTVRHDG